MKQSQGGKQNACPAIIGQQHHFFAKANRPRTIWLFATFIAVLHAFMAVTAVNTKSPTFDEPQHLTAGYSYWVTGDFRLDPENGNLPAMWAALPLLFEDTRFIPLNDRGWRRAEEGRTAHQFFYEIGNDPDRMIGQARIMMSIFGAALCLLVYRIARGFFGVAGGLIAECLAAFDPNFLAHTPLVTSDVPAAFFFTATLWTCWRLFQQISPTRLLAAALCLCGLFLTKFSAPLVLPVVGATAVIQVFARTEIPFVFGRYRLTFSDKWKKACAIAGSLLFLGLALFVSLWAASSFRYGAWIDDPSNHEGTSWHWNYLLNTAGPVEKSLSLARERHILPEEYLYGFAYVRKHEIDRPAFLDNQWSVVGFRSFFPLAFLYKTPLPFLLLLSLSVYAVANRHRWKIENILNPLFTFALAYTAFAVAAKLNIGHRHLLPIYPALFIACGAVVYFLKSVRRGAFACALGILFCWHIGESWAARPDYLAYFNQVAGGPSRGHEHLVDSSLDWGQDLPALKDWIKKDRLHLDQKPVYLAYFGTADPRAYNINAQLILPDNPIAQAPLRLGGGIYCISATILQSVYALEMGPWCTIYERRYQTALAEIRAAEGMQSANGVVKISNTAGGLSPKKIKEFERMRFERLCAYLRHREPVARIGYSILVFDMSDEEVDAAISGPPAELQPEVAVIGY